MLLHWPGATASGTLQHGQPLPSCCRRFEREERLRGVIAWGPSGGEDTLRAE